MEGHRLKTSRTTVTELATGLGGCKTPAPQGKGSTDTSSKPPPFSLTPGHSNATTFINYTLGTGIKLFNSTMEKVPESLMVNPK